MPHTAHALRLRVLHTAHLQAHKPRDFGAKPLKVDKVTGEGTYEVVGRAVFEDGAGQLQFKSKYVAVYQIRDGCAIYTTYNAARAARRTPHAARHTPYTPHTTRHTPHTTHQRLASTARRSPSWPSR